MSPPVHKKESGDHTAFEYQSGYFKHKNFNVRTHKQVVVLALRFNTPQASLAPYNCLFLTRLGVTVDRRGRMAGE